MSNTGYQEQFLMPALFSYRIDSQSISKTWSFSPSCLHCLSIGYPKNHEKYLGENDGWEFNFWLCEILWKKDEVHLNLLRSWFITVKWMCRGCRDRDSLTRFQAMLQDELVWFLPGLFITVGSNTSLSQSLSLCVCERVLEQVNKVNKLINYLLFSSSFKYK